MFFLGDSTTFYLYRGAHAECTRGGDGNWSDPLATVPLERYGPPPLEAAPHPLPYGGAVCQPLSAFGRVGAAIHWGVAPDAPYHAAWDSHRTFGDTTSSVANIARAAAEFAKRAEGGTAAFALASNAWDIKRYLEHFQDRVPPLHWDEEYARNLTSVVRTLKQKARVILLTSFVPAAPYASYSIRLNHQMRAVAVAEKVGMADIAATYNGSCASSYLKDDFHPQPHAASEAIRILADVVKN